MLKIGFLCSGGLGYDTLLSVKKDYNIVFVLTDSNSTAIIEFCEENSIPFFAGNPRKGRGYTFLKYHSVDVIASVNYLFLIEEDIINHSKKLTFNIHGSLLPKYRGRTPHVWAIINGETRAGITAHKIDVGCDTGDIIYQIEIPINKEDTGATMLKKYTRAYVPLIEKVLKGVEKNTIEFRAQDEEKATYFGKRTPQDGCIDWGWTSEQIINWIRAQAYPYPGAFSFYQGRKIIIDKAISVPVNNQLNTKGGEVIATDPQLRIKTGDGAIEIITIRTESCNFEIGKKFENENRT